MSSNELPINLSESFPTLERAPIVEAVLHWQAMASKDYQESRLLHEMGQAFPKYSTTSQHNMEAGFSGTPSGIEFKQRSAWQGVRLSRKHPDGTDQYVCQFLGLGIVFSQLAPYTGWNDFEPEAKKFWKKHCELGDPSEVSRLSVRFYLTDPYRVY